jgi:hypothetical protein
LTNRYSACRNFFLKLGFAHRYGKEQNTEEKGKRAIGGDGGE